MSKALRFSLSIKREIISNDLLKLCKRSFIQVVITEEEIKILIFNKMYDMIEKLILGNTLLEADASHLDVDEIFQAQRLKEKNAEKDAAEERKVSNYVSGQTNKNIEVMVEGGNESSIGSNSNRDAQFEGGDKASNKKKDTKTKKDKNINVENTDATDRDYQEYLKKYKNPDANLSLKHPDATSAHRMVHHINRTAETTPRSKAQPKLIEKYLYTSDFLEYILNNRDLFLQE